MDDNPVRPHAEGSPRWLRDGGFIVGIALFIFLLVFLKNVEPASARYAAAVSALMAVWWLTEAIPIYVTALVPLVLYPALNVFKGGFVVSVRGAAEPYADGYIFLFMGGMALAAGMQQCGLHRRIALTIMKRIGTDPRRLLWGFLCATAFISLWISNTATAVMMVPIGIAVISQYEVQEGKGRLVFYGAAIMMSIAYASNIGGIGTKIGTAPNAQFCGFMERNLHMPVSFLKYLMIGMPVVMMLLPVAWLVLWRIGRWDGVKGRAEVVERQLDQLGPMRRAEKIVLAVFLIAAALWIVSGPIVSFFKPRWPGLQSKHIEAAIGMVCGFSLMAVRIDGEFILTWSGLKLVPWETLLLLGGGMSMAAGIEASGLQGLMGAKLAVMKEMSPVGQIAVASGATVLLTAFASNMATIQVMLQVLSSAVGGDGGSVPKAHVATVLSTATIASSCDFALPAGTPPNAIVFGSGYVSIPRMAKTGIVMDIAAAVIVTFWGATGLRWVFS